MARLRQTPLQLDHLNELPFVSTLEYVLPRTEQDLDGTLKIKTPAGLFKLNVEIKRTYLTREATNATIAHAPKRPRQGAGLLLVAPYIPRPTGEVLIEAGVSFVDSVGNLHLALGDHYNWTMLGKTEPPKLVDKERVTPAAVQMLFQVATHPESAQWTVRELEKATGISKSRVAQVRRQMENLGILGPNGADLQFEAPTDLPDKLLAGYSQILRPKILVGRFRFPERTPEEFLQRLQAEARKLKVRYSLTGGPAAHALQHYYRGSEVPLFLSDVGPATQRGLKLLPDQSGPVIALKEFGQLVYWREVEGNQIAPPWLIYAELMTSADPRAHEAAEELRREFLA